MQRNHAVKLANAEKSEERRRAQGGVNVQEQSSKNDGSENVPIEHTEKLARTPQPQVTNTNKRKGVERKLPKKLVNTNLRTEEKAVPTPSTANRREGWRDLKERGEPKEEEERSRQADPVVPKILSTPEHERSSEEKHGHKSFAEQEAELEKTYIFRLSKKSIKFPRAQYYCRLCNYHIDTVPLCWTHIDQSRHNRLAKAKESENFFKNLPPPSKAHAQALTELLQRVEEEHSLTGSEMNVRLGIARRMESNLQSYLPECRVKLYGSSLSSFGFHDSDVNLDVEAPNEKLASKVLVAVSQAIAARVDKDVTDFEPDFEGKHPCVRFRDKKTNLLCEVGTANQHAVQASQLMVEYNQCDHRLRPLVMGLRYWARLCGIDQQAIGAMPAHTFVLLVIYFLQQCNPPILPILQEVWQNEQLKSKNKQTVGELWVGLLRFYLVGINIEEIVISIRQRKPVTRGDLKLPNRRVAIEDPFANGKKNLAKSLTTSSVFQYIMDRFHDALKYFGIPQTGLSANSAKDHEHTEGEPRPGGAKSPPNHPDAACPATTDSVRDDAPACAEGEQNGKDEGAAADADGCDSAADVGAKLAEMVLREVNMEERGGEEEDAMSDSDGATSNVASSSSDLATDTAGGSEAESERGNSKSEMHSISGSAPEAVLGSSSVDSSLISGANLDSGSHQGSSSMGSESEDPISDANLDVSSPANDADASVGEDEPTPEMGDIEGQNEDPSRARSDSFQRNTDERSDAIEKKDEEVREEEEEEEDGPEKYVFVFDQEILTRGEKVQIICISCLKEGHISKDCPEDALPPLQPLPKMDPNFLELVTYFCKQIFDLHAPTRQDLRHRDNCLRELEYYIRQHSFPKANLSLFGSSGNGFGFRNSDLDICLTFQDQASAEGVDVASVVEDLASALRKNRNLYNIVPIPTAKVPIVKFVHRPTRLEGDISLYNTLAQCNTRLLRAYADIDARAVVLGYTMKFFAKYCDIGDASRGSLSSYAYTLLTVYFLQQREPPVLPVLQELCPGDKMPVHEVDGWNAWFFDDIKRLRFVWRDGGRNRESLGSLWLGLLRFYTEEFDFTKFVVSIRQKKRLTRFEKLWMTPQRGIAIEDPFDLDHNLGGAASKKMATYILQVFRHARQHFGTPNKHALGNYRMQNVNLNYFLDVDKLTGGEAPPNDRGCRICGKIGHFVKDCPVKKRGQDRRDQERRDRERREQQRGKGTPDKSSVNGAKQPVTPSSPTEETGKNTDAKQKVGSEPSTKKTEPTKEAEKPQKTAYVADEVQTKPGKRPKEKAKAVEPVARQLFVSQNGNRRERSPAGQKTAEKAKEVTAPSVAEKERRPDAPSEDTKRERKRSAASSDSKSAPPNSEVIKQKSDSNTEKKSGTVDVPVRNTRVTSSSAPVPELTSGGMSQDRRLRDQSGRAVPLPDRRPVRAEQQSSNTDQPLTRTEVINPIAGSHPSVLPARTAVPSSVGPGTTPVHPTSQPISNTMHNTVPGPVGNMSNGPAPNPGQIRPPSLSMGLPTHQGFPGPANSFANGPYPGYPLPHPSPPFPGHMGMPFPPHFQAPRQIPPYGSKPMELKQQDLTALLHSIQKGPAKPPQGPGQRQAPTQVPLVRAPTTPLTAQTLDEVEHQLRNQQRAEEHQHLHTQQVVQPGIKSSEQIEQQMRQDQFFQNRQPSASDQRRPQFGPEAQQHPPHQHLQQQWHQHHGGDAGLPESSRAVAPPSQSRHLDSEWGRGDQQGSRFFQQPPVHGEQSQPIPIGERPTQWPITHQGPGNPSPTSPPQGNFPFPGQQDLAPGRQPQGYGSAPSPPHNLLRSPPGTTSPPHPYGHSPLDQRGPVRFPDVRGNPLMSMSLSGANPPPSSNLPSTMWPPHPESTPGSDGAGSPQDRREPNRTPPAESQYQGRLNGPRFGPGHGPEVMFPNTAQPFHFSRSGFNPSLPRSSHAATMPPQQPHPQHHQSYPGQHRPDAMWHHHQHHQQQQHLQHHHPQQHQHLSQHQHHNQQRFPYQPAIGAEPPRFSHPNSIPTMAQAPPRQSSNVHTSDELLGRAHAPSHYSS
ncbi:terminal uridylyltransferase 7-like [Diadema setosum]|uniref:terminal uridylyltransferase 7-like n=1 Tax=Diadema setosum TaxID=31175 RepID=UPI003B3ADA34